jgi:diguanylate cyclase (GGDEF)-like protein/PAS domain S-box-containing protein
MTDESVKNSPSPTILVADDDPMMRLLAAKAFEKTGFQVREAENGQEAVAIFDEARPDIVMMDVMMPLMDGFSACVEIRKRPYGELTPVLMVTGLDDVDSIHHAYEAGATDFVTKPINWLILGHRVRYMLRASRSLEALHDSEERYALASQGANDGLWDWNLKTNEIHFSSRWKGMIGHGDHEIGKTPGEWFDRIHPDDIDQARVELDAHLSGVSPNFESEHRLLHKDGTYRWMLTRGLAIRDESGTPYRMAGSQTDTTERKSLSEQLLRDAFYDSLTKLPNRALFMDRLGHAVARGRRLKNHRCAVLFLDLDRFKLVNDSLGHMLGDALLVETAERIGRLIRPGDTIARWGGDEFVILLEDVREVGCASLVAERIQGLFRTPFSLDGHEVFTTVSIGIVVGSEDYARPEELLRDADIAMYRAKEERGSSVTFDRSMHRSAIELLELENDLRRAMERREFRMFYQPIVDLETGKLAGLEALIRWMHPTRGLVFPGSFIHVAEENGLIVPIGEWVLREVCRQIREWQDAGANVRVAVNLSARQLKDRNLPIILPEILKETGVSPDSIDLEITESAVINNWELVGDTLSALQSLGFRLCLDDFGTGYSSLSYLHRLPVTKLKIDRSFLEKMAYSTEHSGIVQTILDLAGRLKMDMVAEGIETEGQLARLKEMKCKLGQGYLFARPLDEETTTSLVQGLNPLPLAAPASRTRLPAAEEQGIPFTLQREGDAALT